MANFRKCLLAFAAIAVLLAVGIPAANAQQTISCLANAGVPPIVRAEGITELVGDVILNCTGGTPTPVGNTIPLSNVTVFLNTNITSRIITTTGSAANASEAVLAIDEPFPTGGPNPTSATPPAGAATQGYCAVTASTGFLSSCSGITATGGGVGAVGPYRTTNIFQGQQVSANSVAWLGLPLDAPGTNATRTIRITNVRANACQLGVSSTLIPTQIVMFIAVNGSQQVSINNPQQTVAFIQPGLVVGGNTKTFLQCNSLNNTLVGSSSNTTTGGPGFATAQEGFASSFKGRSYATPLTNIVGTSTATLQNVFGFPYNTESGFVSTATGGASTGQIGVADYGTRIMFTVNNVGAGVSIFAPPVVPLVLSGSCASNFLSGCITSGGYAVLVTGTDSNGNGGALSTGTPSAFTTAGTGPFAPLCQASSSSTFCSAPSAAITITGTSGVVVYEIVQANPNAIEALVAPIDTAFISNTGSNLPGLGQITATTQFAPQSTVATASSSAPIPRFCPGPAARNFFAINSCSCNLLFPFVTNQAGFDTGVAIANTSLDIYGTAPQVGSVTLNYFGGTTGGGAAPAAQTSQSIPAGQELVFTVSNGGGFGVAATPGFQGYIIAAAKFQYCHGFAFISDLGAQKLAEGYLAIQLDNAGLNRTGQTGENEGH